MHEIAAFGAEDLQKVIQEAAGDSSPTPTGAEAQETHAASFWTFWLRALRSEAGGTLTGNH